MSEQNDLRLDSNDFEEFKRAVEAVNTGKLEVPAPNAVNDDGDPPDDGSTNDVASNDDTTQDDNETDEQKAERVAAEKAAADKAAAEKDKTKPRKSVSQRIAEFRRALTDAQEVANIEASEAERLRREVEELRKQVNAPKDTPAQGKKTYERLEGEPNPKDYEFGVIDPAYQRDLTKFFVEADQKAARESAEANREASEGQQKFLDTVARGLEKYDDYIQVVVQGADTGKWRLTPIAAQTIVDSEVGHEIAYHLATNPDEAAEIADLPPHRQAAAIGRLEARFIAAEADTTADNGDDNGDQGKGANTPPPVGKKATSAPPPPETRERTSAGEFRASPDTKDFNAYRRLVEKHRNGR